MSWRHTHRKIRGNRDMTALAAYAETDAPCVRDVIQRIYGPLKNGVKLLARDAHATPRAAENWISGLCSPQADKLITIMRHNDAVAAEIFRLAGRE